MLEPPTGRLHDRPSPRRPASGPSPRRTGGRPQPPALRRSCADAPPSPFRVTIARRGGTWQVGVAGELDLAGVDRLRTAVHRLAWRREPTLLDLSAMTFTDASGVALLVALSDAAASTGWDLAVSPLLSPAVERVLALTGAGPFVRFAGAAGTDA